jgi:oligopeptide/dipeptide ABC transporter ATP-binding protein
VLAQPRHPYTARLLASTPDLTRPLDAPLPGIPGQLPEAGAPRDRCLFAPRCERARPECSAAAPPLAMVQGREVACLFPLDGPAA